MNGVEKVAANQKHTHTRRIHFILAIGNAAHIIRVKMLDSDCQSEYKVLRSARTVRLNLF